MRSILTAKISSQQRPINELYDWPLLLSTHPFELGNQKLDTNNNSSNNSHNYGSSNNNNNCNTNRRGSEKNDHFKIVFIVESRSMTSGSNSNEIVFVDISLQDFCVVEQFTA